MSMFQPPVSRTRAPSLSVLSARSFCVVSYNVLSSHLAAPDHFRACNPNDLEQHTRLRRVKQKLKDECEKGSILCLQEVSAKWAGPLHAFLASHGYHMVTGLYGKAFNGYMGVAIAWPTKKFEAIDVDVSRLSDHVRWNKPPKPTGLVWVLATLRSLIRWPLVAAGLINEDAKDALSEAKGRMNIMLFARLKEVSSGKVVCVGTYHMPCMFWLPSVMVMHTALVSQRIKALAGNDPHVLAGDFNFKPDSSMYQLITEARLDESHPEYPDIPDWEPWRPTVPQPMHSAYKDVNGQEPAFTNNAKIKEQDPFIETLDYIFYSPHLEATSVYATPEKKDGMHPYPDSTEPSDHILIGATFDWKK